MYMTCCEHVKAVRPDELINDTSSLPYIGLHLLEPKLHPRPDLPSRPTIGLDWYEQIFEFVSTVAEIGTAVDAFDLLYRMRVRPRSSEPLEE